MAEDLTVARPNVAERRRRAPRAHVRKFAVAYAALTLIAAGAVAGLVTALDMERKADVAWSEWVPAKEGEAKLWEIADYVGAQYVDANAQPIVQLLASPPYVQVPTEQGLTRIFVDGVIVKGRASDRSDARAGVFRNGSAFMYILCSTGRNCALTPEQNESDTLGLQLQREVLELALYTFKYTSGVDHLLLFLPPFRTTIEGQEQQVKAVAYLERDDLKAALGRPLDQTLPGPDGQVADARDRAAILSYVTPKLFTFQMEEGPQGLTLLTLTALGAR